VIVHIEALVNSYNVLLLKIANEAKCNAALLTGVNMCAWQETLSDPIKHGQHLHKCYEMKFHIPGAHTALYKTTCINIFG